MAEAKKTDVPVHFRNICLMDNYDGMKRLLEHKLGKEGAEKFQTIDIYQMILALVDETCSSFIDAREMGRRLDALEEGTVRTDTKTRIPLDMYYAVMSGLQQSAVYCAEDKKTGMLIAGPLSSVEPAPVTYIAFSRKIISDRFNPGGKAVKLKMDDFILRCADEGIEGFIVDQGTAQSQFDVKAYEEYAVASMSARRLVNSVIGEGISGDLLFPALVSYMNHMDVDVRLKDGRKRTGFMVSLPTSYSTEFMVANDDIEQKPLTADRDSVEWLRVHMSDDTE